MSCADVCLDMDYDACANDFYHERMVVARKAHRCCECGEAIPVGARYQRATGKSDGEVWTATTCAVCAEIRQAFVCGSWVFGGLWDEIEDVMFPVWNEQGPLDCLAKLQTIEARDKCRTRYREWREDGV